jgi:hypothetical protein
VNSRAILLTVIISLVLLTAQPQVGQANLRGYSVVHENEFLRLYVNAETAEFAVQDKASEEVWYGGLPEVRQETVKRGAARDAMRGMFTLNYYTPSREARSLNSYVDSVLNEEFSVTPSAGGVRFDFILGKQWGEDAYYPVFIQQEKFESLLEQVADRFDRQILEEAYTLIVGEERDYDPYTNVFVYGMDVSAVLGYHELVVLKGKLLDRYIGTNNTPVERLKHYVELVADTIVSRRMDYDRRGLITPADLAFLKTGQPIYALLDTTYPAYYKPELARIFMELGYTPADVAADHSLTTIDPPKPNPQIFRVPAEVKLDGPDLVVTILAGELEYPINVETPTGERATYMPQSMDVLPLFGAAGRNAEGYLFVPDRSGGLMYLNNTKKLPLPSYFGAVYGPDRSVAPQQEQISPGPLVRLPVFGLKEEGRAWLAIIEEGQAIANISAELAGKTDSFNKAYARFTLTPRTTITLYGVQTTQDDRMVDAYAVLPYKGSITIRYKFLTGEAATYVGMATAYREYLVNHVGVQPIDQASPVPMVVELIGGFHDREPVLGAPREVIRPMTTYTQAAQIASDLKARGTDLLRLRYVGWSRGGIEHYFPNTIRLEKALGKKDELLKLLAADGVEVYLDVNFMTVMRDTAFDSFRTGKHGARFLNRSAARVFKFDQITLQQIPDKYAYILSPNHLGWVVDGFLKDLAEYPGANISLRRMGSVVYSDNQDREDRAVTRQDALVKVKEQMARLAASGRDLLAEGGNDSAFPYARQIVEAPTDGSVMLIIDEVVPFYQIALHGLIDFSGQPYNLGGVTREKLLKTLETGEIPYFRWSYADSSAVKGTDFAYLLGTTYWDTVDAAAALFSEVKPILEKVRGQAIVDHIKLDEGVYRTIFANGVEIVVNYSDTGVLIDGTYVEGKGYAVHERRGHE